MNTTALVNPQALKVSTSILTAWRDARDVLVTLFAQALFAWRASLIDATTQTDGMIKNVATSTMSKTMSK